MQGAAASTAPALSTRGARSSGSGDEVGLAIAVRRRTRRPLQCPTLTPPSIPWSSVAIVALISTSCSHTAGWCPVVRTRAATAAGKGCRQVWCIPGRLEADPRTQATPRSRWRRWPRKRLLLFSWVVPYCYQIDSPGGPALMQTCPFSEFGGGRRVIITTEYSRPHPDRINGAAAWALRGRNALPRLERAATVAVYTLSLTTASARLSYQSRRYPQVTDDCALRPMHRSFGPDRHPAHALPSGLRFRPT